MPKLKCTFEFYESNLLSEFGYSIINPTEIDNRVYICDLHGPNLERYSDDDLVFLRLDASKNKIKIRKTGKWQT